MIINTESIIVNLMYENKRDYCTLEEIQKTCAYTYEQLIKQRLLKRYSIKFAIDLESIERNILYNSTIFNFDNDGNIVSIRESNMLKSLLSDFAIDLTITKIIRNSIK